MTMDDNYSSIINVEMKWEEIAAAVENYKKECLNNLIRKSFWLMTVIKRKIKVNSGDTLQFLFGQVDTERASDILSNYILEYTKIKEDSLSNELMEKKSYQVPIECEMEFCKTYIIDYLKPCRYAILFSDSISNYTSEKGKPIISYTNREMDKFLDVLVENKEILEEDILSLATIALEKLIEKLKVLCENVRMHIHEKVLENDFTINGRSISIERLYDLDKKMADIIYAVNDSNCKEALKYILNDEELISFLCYISDGYYKYCEDVICTLDDIYELMYTFGKK